MNESYLKFVERKPEKPQKTRIFDVETRNGTGLLGEVRWYGPWRQYCFFPAGDTVWSRGCMKEVIDAMVLLSLERRKHGS